MALLDTSTLEDVKSGLIQVKDLLDEMGHNTEASFTASDMTPSAGTITGGTKVASKIVRGDLVWFNIAYINWTQNTSTSTQYFFDLPETSSIGIVALYAFDLSTGLAVPAWIRTTTTGRLQVSKTATSAVNIYVAGTYPKA